MYQPRTVLVLEAFYGDSWARRVEEGRLWDAAKSFGKSAAMAGSIALPAVGFSHANLSSGVPDDPAVRRAERDAEEVRWRSKFDIPTRPDARAKSDLERRARLGRAPGGSPAGQ